MNRMESTEIMENHKNEIHPEFHKIIPTATKEKFLNQHARVFWLTGLSGSGKTTIGSALEKELFKRNFFTQVLDGDNVRTGINNNLSFSVEDRTENIRRIAEVSRLFVDCGIIVISCFISPTNEIRDMAKRIIGEDRFIEVFIDAPIEVCEERDVKGLYKKARNGEIKNFTGISSPYDIPTNPDLILKTNQLSIEQSVNTVLDYILPLITYKDIKG